MALFDTGWTDLTSHVNRAGADQDWASPDNATLSDNTYTVITAVSTTVASDYLQGKTLSGGIKTGSFVEGIELRIEKLKTIVTGSGTVTDKDIRLFLNDSPTGNNKSAGAEWPTSEAYVSYGSSTDLWGISFINDVDVNNTNFGHGIRVDATGTGGTTLANTDNVQLRIHYNPTGMFMAM